MKPFTITATDDKTGEVLWSRSSTEAIAGSGTVTIEWDANDVTATFASRFVSDGWDEAAPDDTEGSA